MSHPMDMVRVCPTCLEASRTCQNNDIAQLRSNGCLEPQVHEEHDSENENWLFTVINERSGTMDYVLIVIYNLQYTSLLVIYIHKELVNVNHAFIN